MGVHLTYRSSTMIALPSTGRPASSPVFYTWCVRPIPWILLCSALSAAPPVRFAEHTVATGLTGGYQVVAVDMNHDGKIDLVALASGMTELVWFENPGWRARPHPPEISPV